MVIGPPKQNTHLSMQYQPNQLLEIFEQRLREVECLNQREPRTLYEPVHYVLGMGGKRLRPILTLLACNLFSDEIEGAIPAALGLEIFHNFTLLHDDIMDQAPLRRNRPTVHMKWNANTAILSGDAMAIAAYMQMTASPPDLLGAVLPIFNNTALQVCEGQQLDMEFEVREEVTLPEYLGMINLKTAVLPAACLQIGALVGGASDGDATLLYEFGRLLGLGFQLQDDLLDVYGDPAVFGKTIGGDIVAGKKTFLLINALQSAPDELKLLIRTALRHPDPGERVRQVTLAYDQLKIRERTLAAQHDFFSQAFSKLEQVGVSPLRKGILERYLRDLTMRTR